MLAEFRTENFKNFDEKIVFKLDEANNYEFSENAVRDGIVKTALLYGKNGSGKTNLGLALMDISFTITDKMKSKQLYEPYTNLDNAGTAKFYYRFIFDSVTLEYEYEKITPQLMIMESVKINGREVIFYNHTISEGKVLLEGAETLRNTLTDPNLSFVKFIRNNTELTSNEENKAFESFVSFVDNMLFFSSLIENMYLGYTNDNSSLSESIIEKGEMKNLESFLNEAAGLDYRLEEREFGGRKSIVCSFNKKRAMLFDIASTGTRALVLFFYWLTELDKVSFVIMDEFDAFYHFQLAEMVVRKVLEKKTQALFTTHNTYLMHNDLLRPDCIFCIEGSSIVSISNSTDKELRKAHNIEKMYRARSANE